MKRANSIEALIRKARTAASDLKGAYQKCLHEQNISDYLKVDIKNVFENLRSCLDFFAHDIFEHYCKGEPGKLYFPICDVPASFQGRIKSAFPGLGTNAPMVMNHLESVQPYKDAWLKNFNALNNLNKHQQLVEQTRTESRQVEVQHPTGGKVTWNQGNVRFGSGVSILGVPIDPRTQLPIPNSTVETKMVVWVDFKFKETNESVLPFIEQSISKVESFYQTLNGLINRI